MSNLFMNAWDGAAEIMVDPSKVQINAAGTNMTVATYNEERLNRGDKRPEYKNFHSLTFNKKDLAKMEGIFKDEQQKLKKKIKNPRAQTQNEQKSWPRPVLGRTGKLKYLQISKKFGDHSPQ